MGTIWQVFLDGLVLAATTWIRHQQVARATPAHPGQPHPAALRAVTTGVITAVRTTMPAGLLRYWVSAGIWSVDQQADLLR